MGYTTPATRTPFDQYPLYWADKDGRFFFDGYSHTHRHALGMATAYMARSDVRNEVTGNPDTSKTEDLINRLAVWCNISYADIKAMYDETCDKYRELYESRGMDAF